MTSCRALTVLALMTSTAVLTHGQAPQPTFEVASIRRNESGSGGSGLNVRPGGAFTATNYSLARLVQYAYNMSESQIVGGPDWIRSDRFDVTARAAADVPRDQIALMVQSLLRDRFKLRLRPDKREMQVLELLLARGDGRVGPNLRDCADPDIRAATNSVTAPRGGAAAAGGCGSLARLVGFVGAQMNSIVVDKTGLKGEWRYSIMFGPDLQDSGNPDLVPFATALREQLGLRLERTRGPVDVLVIESVDTPTEN